MQYFYPRPPRGGRLLSNMAKILRMLLFLSTPSARRATQAGQTGEIQRKISIHALREEGDRKTQREKQRHTQFLSTPSARRATAVLATTSDFLPFLSTPSARRATHHLHRARRQSCNFYPRPPRGGRRDTAKVQLNGLINFYPRPPRGGRPGLSPTRCWTLLSFLSTPSARRATSIRPHWQRVDAISIHALREEGDKEPDRGGQTFFEFLSTPSARRATLCGL